MIAHRDHLPEQMNARDAEDDAGPRKQRGYEDEESEQVNRDDWYAVANKNVLRTSRRRALNRSVGGESWGVVRGGGQRELCEAELRGGLAIGSKAEHF